MRLQNVHDILLWNAFIMAFTSKIFWHGTVASAKKITTIHCYIFGEPPVHHPRCHRLLVADSSVCYLYIKSHSSISVINLLVPWNDLHFIVNFWGVFWQNIFHSQYKSFWNWYFVTYNKVIFLELELLLHCT